MHHAFVPGDPAGSVRHASASHILLPHPTSFHSCLIDTTSDRAVPLSIDNFIHAEDRIIIDAAPVRHCG